MTKHYIAATSDLCARQTVLPVSSSSASYVLSVSCLFLRGPLRRISVNARFYVLCRLVLSRGGCYGGPLQFPDESQAQTDWTSWKSSLCWLDSPVVYPDLMLVVVCGRDKCCMCVRLMCLLHVYTVFCSICGERQKSAERSCTRHDCKWTISTLNYLGRMITATLNCCSNAIDNNVLSW